MSLRQKLKNHDWFSDYSDDPSVRRRAATEKAALQNALIAVTFPYKWWDLFYAFRGCIVENYSKDENGRYYHPDWTYNYASVDRSELITQSEADEINKWIDDHDDII